MPGKRTPSERLISVAAAMKPDGFTFELRGTEAGVVEIDAINAEPRGKGIGTRGMEMFTRLADELGVRLELEAWPFDADEDEDEEGESFDELRDRLIEFYRRCGFRMDRSATYGRMVRKPAA